MDIPARAQIVGTVLTVLGIIAYVMSAMVSVTALIPAFIGAPMVLLGIAARRESWRKHAMHGAAVLALAGLAGALMRMLTIGSGASALTAVSLTLMAGFCLLFLVFAIRSFILARKAGRA